MMIEPEVRDLGGRVAALEWALGIVDVVGAQLISASLIESDGSIRVLGCVVDATDQERTRITVGRYLDAMPGSVITRTQGGYLSVEVQCGPHRVVFPCGYADRLAAVA